MIFVSPLAACARSASSPVDAAAADLSGAAGPDQGLADLAPPLDFTLPTDLTQPADLRPAPDLRGVSLLPCGPHPCPSPAQACCSGDQGKTGTCVAAAMQCPNQGLRYECQGPEDCGGGQVCCFKVDRGSFCNNGCVFGQISYIVCHRQADCQNGGTCQPLAQGSPYKGCS